MNKFHEIAEKLVELGILELTNQGQTYRVTLAGREIVKLLKNG
jgi:predicted transcriptional regulator